MSGGKIYIPLAESLKREVAELLPSLRACAMAYCGDRKEADDLVAAALERASDEIDDRLDDEPVEDWLFRLLEQVRREHAFRSRLPRHILN